ncbi:MAG: hypothetical protein IPN07_16840 [Dehalococcoidia bacterium]|nr:hypothetical protein [Dehalococcoidia bacterium]
MVYRIIADAVRVAVGNRGDVQMACSSSGKIGKAAALTPEELAKVDYQVDVWRRLEREALDEVGLQELAPAPPAEGG